MNAIKRYFVMRVSQLDVNNELILQAIQKGKIMQKTISGVTIKSLQDELRETRQSEEDRRKDMHDRMQDAIDDLKVELVLVQETSSASIKASEAEKRRTIDSYTAKINTLELERKSFISMYQQKAQRLDELYEQAEDAYAWIEANRKVQERSIELQRKNDVAFQAVSENAAGDYYAKIKTKLKKERPSLLSVINDEQAVV
jgi:hypothetical protein